MTISEPRINILLAKAALSGKRAILEVSGNLDQSSNQLLEAKVAEVARLAAESRAQILLDLSRLQFVDSEGAFTIIHSVSYLRAVSPGVEILYPSPMAPELLEMCRYLQILGVDFGRPPPSMEIPGSSEPPKDATKLQPVLAPTNA